MGRVLIGSTKTLAKLIRELCPRLTQKTYNHNRHPTLKVLFNIFVQNMRLAINIFA